jgi:hypothetical protein
MCGREMLKKGMIWRVGHGNDALIWEDQLISGVPGLKLLVHNDITELKTMTELIKTATGNWGDELVKKHFVLNPTSTASMGPRR